MSNQTYFLERLKLFAFSRQTWIGKKMGRTKLLSTLLVLILLSLSPALGQVSVARIGVLGAPEEPRFSELVAGLKHGLRELGYSEQTIEIVEGRVLRDDRVSERVIVERMVQQQRIRLLFAMGSRLVPLIRQVSADLPIVFITPGDPVAAGLVMSLARPGGNTTGMTFEYPELSGKRLELLKEVAPRVRRVLVMYDPRDDSPKQGVKAARDAAPKLGIALVQRETRTSQEITQALKALSDVDAFLAIPGGQPTAHYKEVIQAANAKRRPTIFHARTGSTEEALASYGSGCRQDSQRKQGRRNTRGAPNKITLHHQPENSQADRPDDSTERTGTGG
jgi:putative tryptophan/tyrosine transport system substrate-binding protein